MASVFCTSPQRLDMSWLPPLPPAPPPHLTFSTLLSIKGNHRVYALSPFPQCKLNISVKCATCCSSGDFRLQLLAEHRYATLYSRHPNPKNLMKWCDFCYLPAAPIFSSNQNIVGLTLNNFKAIENRHTLRFITKVCKWEWQVGLRFSEFSLDRLK